VKWTYTADCQPPENVLLEVLQSDLKTQSKLIRDGRLYWLPDRSMYVYYTPTMWRIPNA